MDLMQAFWAYYIIKNDALNSTETKHDINLSAMTQQRIRITTNSSINDIFDFKFFNSFVFQ